MYDQDHRRLHLEGGYYRVASESVERGSYRFEVWCKLETTRRPSMPCQSRARAARGGGNGRLGFSAEGCKEGKREVAMQVCDTLHASCVRQLRERAPVSGLGDEEGGGRRKWAGERATIRKHSFASCMDGALPQLAIPASNQAVRRSIHPRAQTAWQTD